MKRREFIKVSSVSGAFVLAGASHAQGIIISDDKVIEPQKEIPVAGSYDVVIAGAGPAGIGAAVASARNGAKTLLIESNGCLGGTWTSGLLSWIIDSENKNGLIKEIREKLDFLKAGHNNGYTYAFDIEKMKLVLEELVSGARVEIMLHGRVVGGLKNKNKITHLITESKSGREAFSGTVFIDCTGDGDLAKFLGCEFEVGRASDHAVQPMSMLAMISGVTYKEIEPFVRRNGENGSITKQRLLEEIMKAGIDPSYKQPAIFPVRDNLFMIMANHEYKVQADNAVDITRATIRGRKEVNKIIDGLKSLGGIWQNIFITATAEHIGVREGRRIKGLYTVTENDIYTGVRHDDAICRVTFGVDVHSLDAGEKDNNYHTGKSQAYDIPYRAIVSKDVDNLLMAGRNISGDFISHSSYRVTGNAMVLGESAGLAAAMCVKKKIMPSGINIKDLKEL